MKKFIALFLALVLCIGLVACGNPGTEQPTNSPEPTPSATPTPDPIPSDEPAATAADYLANAKSYVRAMYKDKAGKVLRDFDVVASVKIGEFTYDVVWTTDAAEENVKIGEPANNKITIDVNEKPVGEDMVFTLTATVTADGKSESTTFEFYVPAVEASGTAFVDAPEEGATYKFGLVQAELGKTLYFTGEMSGNYFATSESPAYAVDVTVEAVDGGHRLYFMKGEVKTYIDVIPRADNPEKVNVVLSEAPTCTFTWDAERKTYTTVVNGNAWYLGCYGTYNTISASATSYIEDVTKIGVSQFPAGLCTVTVVAEQVAEPAADTAYKYAVVQNTLGQTIYFKGEMSGNYLATSTNPAEGVNIFVENVDGGARLYFMKGEVKTYIDVIPRADNPEKVNVVLTEAPTCVFTWDAERKTYTTVVNGNGWYLGCYSSYNTISASATSYIEDVTKIGDSQFPAGPYLVEGYMDVQPSFVEEVYIPTDPAEIVDAAYVLADGASLPYSCTLVGTVVTIDTPYSEQYGNITVSIAVAGKEDKPVMCFRLKGEGAAALEVGSIITVTGTIMNYGGTVEFGSGCTLDAVVVVPTDAAGIIAAAYAMGENDTLPYASTLTGAITSIDTEYSEQYGNITVTIAVEGFEDQPIQCYRLKGEGAAELAVGDVITVTGTLSTYKSKVQFKAGCTVDAVVSKAPAADTLATAVLGTWTDTATGYVLSFTETTYETLQGEAVLNSWTYVWNDDGTMSLTDVTGMYGTCVWEVSIVDGRLIVKDLTFGLSYDCTKN